LPLRLQYFEYLDEVQNQYTTPLEIELAPGYVVSVPGLLFDIQELARVDNICGQHARSMETPRRKVGLRATCMMAHQRQRPNRRPAEINAGRRLCGSVLAPQWSGGAAWRCFNMVG
jgi:hypothetical protein